MYRQVFRNLCRFLQIDLQFLNYNSKCARVKISNDYKTSGKRKGAPCFYQNILYVGLGSSCLFLMIICEKLKKKCIIPSVKANDIFGGQRSKFNFIADVVEKTAQSVVFIGVFDSKRKDFFTGQPALKSNGSGFIVSPDGLILTNAHVVSQKRQLNLIVKLQDGSTYPAFVEDIDVRTDLATLRIKCEKKLYALKLGSIRDLRPGEWVVAIGSPLSLANTATCGVVSAVDRTAPELGLFGSQMYYIQTDAAITFGNSGGPLVNLNGEVIGINSMKVTTGISFAIPIEYAKKFLHLTPSRSTSQGSVAESTKDIPKKFTGITVLSLNIDIIRELQFRDRRIPEDVTFGVLIWRVVEESPACLAGLLPGDILTHVNGVAIRNTTTLYNIIENSHYSTLKIVVVRGDTRLTLSVIPENIW